MPPTKQFEPAASGTSLPLLVRMPDGERHQVDVAPTASVKDLKTSIANLATWGSASPPAGTPASPAPSDALAGWDLDFAGSVLNDANNLNDYHIPDAYDHASGLLRTISDSAHADAGKKVEALDKACAVVAGISRGERDMERLISAVFDDDEQQPNPANPEEQPSIRAMRRSRRSRIPSLNFANLPPLGPLPSASAGKSPRSKAFPSAPPTPSQLIRKLSASRPDLYDPAVAARATDPTPSPQPAAAAPAASGELKRGAPWLPGAPAADGQSGPPATQGQTAAPGAVSGSGELKRGNTWFSEVINSFGNSVPKPSKRIYDGNGSSEDDEPNNAHDDVEGDSEGEEEHATMKQEKHITGQDGEKEQERNTPSPAGKTESTIGADPPKNVSVSGENKIAGTGPDATTDKGSIASGKDIVSAAKPAQHTATGISSAGTNPARSAAAAAAAGPENTGSGDAAANSNAKPAENSKPAERSGDPASSVTGGASTAPSSGATSQENKPPGAGLDTTKQVIGLEPEQPAPVEDVKQPKKRGRKRKNPHLSEEQRKLQRQAQNRESAKLSRIRRKNMTIEYEKRVTTLEGENENLRDTVMALTDRLEILQSMLTISVQKRPAVAVAGGSQPFSAPNVAGMPVGVAGLPGVQGVPGVPGVVAAPPQVHTLTAQHVSAGLGLAPPAPQPQHHPHQLTNMQYKNF